MPYLDNCTSSQEYDDWIDAQLEYYQNEDERRVLEGIAAIAAGILALILADRMFDIGEDALQKEYEIRNRIFEVQKKYVEHWQNVEFPQKTLVCGVIYALEAPLANYPGITSAVSLQGYGTGGAAETGIDVLNEKNRVDCDQRGCANDAQMMAPVAIVQAANYLFRHQERRRYDMDDEYRRFAASTHRGLEVKPDQVFALLGNAASLYSAIGAAATSAASGAGAVAGGFFGIAAESFTGGNL